MRYSAPGILFCCQCLLGTMQMKSRTQFSGWVGISQAATNASVCSSVVKTRVFLISDTHTNSQ